MKKLIGSFFALFLVSMITTPSAAGATPLTVVELFTSQGCSSCPPADSFAGELAKREDVLPLSFNVDYWNYIGWDDPFSSPEKTQRQKEYARNLGLRHVYTPQVVINGKTEAVGSRKHAVNELIRKAANQARVDVQLREKDGKLSVTIGEAVRTLQSKAEVILVVYDKKRVTKIKRGENAGRELAYYNVVQSFQSIGHWKGDVWQAQLNKTEILGMGDGCAILLQQAHTGAILGAAALSFL